MCDLAGAERAGKTHGSHDRLKEAGNINSSLLVLSRCIEALRYGFLIVNLFIVCVCMFKCTKVIHKSQKFILLF